MEREAVQTHRGWLIFFIFGLVFIQGILINLMPVMFGTIARTFEANLRQQGQVQSFFSIGSAVALLVSGYVTEYFGAKMSGVLTLVFAGLGAMIIGFAPNYQIVLFGAAVLGLGCAWVLAVYSAVITLHFSESRQRMFMLVLALFAGSAILGPYLLGYLLTVVPRWQLIFQNFGLFLWLWLIMLLLVGGRKLEALKRRKVSKTLVQREPSNLHTVLRSAHQVLISGLFNRAALWLLGLIVVFDMLAAGAIVHWTPRFFQIQYGMDEARGGLLLSAMAAGVFLGRLFMSAFVVGRLSDRVLLAVCYAGGMIAYAGILLSPSYGLGLFLMGLSGAFLAAQAPTVYSLAAVKFGERGATAIPLTDAIGMAFGLFGPILIGFSADRWGLLQVLWFVPVVGALLVILALGWELYDRRLGPMAESEGALRG